jgi:hypothetical protein
VVRAWLIEESTGGSIVVHISYCRMVGRERFGGSHTRIMTWGFGIYIRLKAN